MKLNVGTLKYDLFTTDEIIIDMEDENCLVAGATSPFESTITVSNRFPLQIRKQSLWHELFHAFFDELGRPDLFEDEGVVDGLAKQVSYFLQANNLDKIYKFIGDDNGKSNSAKTEAKSA